MDNKENIELSKEELMTLIDGLDCIDDIGYALFSEYNVSYQDLRKKLSEVFYKLEWRD